MKKVVAMYEEEGNYARKLAEYLSRKESVPFELRFFSDADRLSSYLETHKPEYLVLSENEPGHRFDGYTSGDLVYLTEKKNEKDNEIYKYQSTEEVLNQLIMKMNCREGLREAGTLGKTEVYGIYSPVGRCGKTTFALLLGDTLARDRSVLYMSFDAFAGSDELLGEHAHTLSDVIFRYRQGKLRENLREMLFHWHHVDMLAGAACPEDLLLVSGTEWKDMIHMMAEECSYDAIVLDLGDQLMIAQEMFCLCRQIFVPILDKRYANQQIKRFDSWLEGEDKSGFRSRVMKVQLPYKESSMSLEAQLEYELWGEAGDYVRSLIRQAG